MSDGKITRQQQQAVMDAFNLRLGRAVAGWGYVESGLCQYFLRLTGMNQGPNSVTGRRIFYSGFGFDSRARMLGAVLGWVKTKPDINEWLNKIIGKARNYAGSRNEILHGDVLFIGYEKSKYFGQSIILQGSRHWHADPPDSEVITAQKLEYAAENFGRLAAIIAVGLN